MRASWLLLFLALARSAVAEQAECGSWAAAGECTKNAEFMLQNCMQACSAHPQTAEGEPEQCVGWAAQGECTRNPKYMMEQCPRSCKEQRLKMFDGALVSVPDMPWSYLPTLFALQLPEVLLVLLTAAVITTFMSLSRSDVAAKRKTIMLMLTLAATLPLVIAMVKRPALYNGIRHFIFVIPPMAVLGGVAFARGMDWLGEYRRAWQPAALAVFAFGLLLPLSEMIRLHPYQYTHFNHIAGTVRTADNFFMLDYWGLALKQASDGLREQLAERQEAPPQHRKWKVAVCGPQRPAQVALGPDFTIGWDSHAADFAMTLGEFYCKGLAAPVMVEIKRDDVVFARVYDIRGRSISSLLAIPAP